MKTPASLIPVLVLTCRLGVLAADPLDQWHWRNPLPNGKLLSALTYANGQFVAVGEDGAVATSPDGTNWTELSCAPLVDPPGGRYGLGDICYGAGTFVAVGSGQVPGGLNGSFGVSSTSTDTTNWTAPRRIVGTSALLGVTYGNGIFVAVGVGSTEFEPVHLIVLTSTDGIEWIAQDLLKPHFPYDIAYGNGRFVLVGEQGTIFTSSNGVDWTDRSLDALYDLRGVAFGNGLFVALGTQTIATSGDGDTWTRQDTKDFPSSGVTYGEGRFVSVGGGGLIYTSTNGTNWTKSTSGTAKGLDDVAYGNGRFVALGAGMMLTSSNGVVWSTLGSQAIPFDSWYNEVVYGNGRFVAAGGWVGDPIPILSSADGLDWSTSAGFSTTFCDAALGNGTFVAVGDRGAIFTSTNALDWFSQRTGTTAILKGICYGNARFVAVGDDGAILVSSNAVDWVPPGLGINNDLATITFGKNLFVAAGASGILLTSTNGYQWDLQFSGTGSPILGLAYGNGVFVATTPDAALRSTNGVDWTLSFSGSGFSGGRICYGHETFVVLAGWGGIWTSTNAVNWMKRNLPTERPLGGVAFGRRTFVAVGLFGTVIQSGELPPGELVWGPVVPLPNGVYSISATGTPGENWQIQVSRDSVQWEPLLDIFNPDSTFELLDEPPIDDQQRFYRAVGR